MIALPDRNLTFPLHFADALPVEGELIGVYPAMIEDTPIEPIHPLVPLFDQNKSIQDVQIREFVPYVFINLDVTVDGCTYGVAVWWVGEGFDEKVVGMSGRELRDLLMDDYRVNASTR